MSREFKFKCEDCGCLFYEPKAVRESRGEYWGVPAYETMYYCPHCGSDAYEEYSEGDYEREEE